MRRWLSLLLALYISAMVVAQAQAQEEPPKVDSARDFLELLGVSGSELEFFQSGSEFTPEEFDALNRVLSAIPRLPQRMVLRWQKSTVDWKAVAADPNALRGELLPLTGRLKSTRQITLSKSVAERFGFSQFFESRLDLSESPETQVILFTRELPARVAKLAGQPLNERIRVAGLYLKSNCQGDQCTVYAIANSLAWHPDDRSAVDVIPHQLELSRRGMNLGSLDRVTDRTSLRSHDRDAFYEMLAAVGRADPLSLEELAEPSDAMTLLQLKKEDRGRFFTIQGTARRAIPVQVNDIEIFERLGISRYYEIEVFDSQANVRIKRNKSDETGVTFSSYPIVCCVHELPEGMQTGDFIHENVEITGAYLKLWAYQSAYLNDSVKPGAKRPMQISPMLIGRTAKRISGTPTSNARLGTLVGIGFIAAVIVLAGIVVLNSRGDRKFRDRIRSIAEDDTITDDEPEIMIE